MCILHIYFLEPSPLHLHGRRRLRLGRVMTFALGLFSLRKEALACAGTSFQSIKLAGAPSQCPRCFNILKTGSLYLFTFCLRALFAVFRLSPLAASAKLRSRSFSNILIFSEKLSEASFLRVSFLFMSASKIPALKLLPL